jgi:hypothetical protein
MSSTSTNRAQLRKLINHSGYFCKCFQDKVIRAKQAYNDPTQPNIIRVAHLLNTSTLGGRTTFGNPNRPPLTYLGGAEGQSGGLPRPPRNKF